MSEEGTVVIDLEETEKTAVGELSGLERAEARGVLSVNNVSDRSRIWNVRVLLEETAGGTSFSEESISAGEIDAGAKWETDYKIDIKKPILTLTERFDTCGTVQTDEPHWAYVYGKENPVKITIKVKNETDGQLDNIVLNKTMLNLRAPGKQSLMKGQGPSSGKTSLYIQERNQRLSFQQAEMLKTQRPVVLAR
ncbi:MAG: hypothetical protein ACW975_05880 [Candidatus Thorarchaeota archaeon]